GDRLPPLSVRRDNWQTSGARTPSADWQGSTPYSRPDRRKGEYRAKTQPQSSKTFSANKPWLSRALMGSWASCRVLLVHKWPAKPAAGECLSNGWTARLDIETR